MSSPWFPPNWSVLPFTTSQAYLGEGNGTPLQYSCLENPMGGGAWWAAVHGVAKSRTWLSDFTFTFHFHALEKEMATHSSALAWRIPGTGEPGGLPSVGLHRVGHDWSDLAAVAAGIFTIFLKVRLRSPWKLSIIEWEESVDAEARNIRVRLLDWLLLKILWSCTSYWTSLTFSAFICMMGMLQALNEAKQSMLPIV